MKKIVAEFFKRPITKEQSKDTGMAMVLLLLLFSGAFKRETLVTIAIVALVVDMTFPLLYRPVAVLWLGLSHLQECDRRCASRRAWLRTRTRVRSDTG